MRDRYAAMRKLLTERVLSSTGTLDTATREAVAHGGTLPDALTGYVTKVREHAYRVTDADIVALKAAGYSEDQIFELTISAAFGAAMARLDPALASIQAANAAASESVGGGAGQQAPADTQQGTEQRTQTEGE